MLITHDMEGWPCAWPTAWPCSGRHRGGGDGRRELRVLTQLAHPRSRARWHALPEHGFRDRNVGERSGKGFMPEARGITCAYPGAARARSTPRLRPGGGCARRAGGPLRPRASARHHALPPAGPATSARKRAGLVDSRPCRGAVRAHVQMMAASRPRGPARMRMGATLAGERARCPAVTDDLGIQKRWLSLSARAVGRRAATLLHRRALAATRYLVATRVSTMLDALTQVQIWRFLMDGTSRRGIGLVSHSPALTDHLSHARRAPGRA